MRALRKAPMETEGGDAAESGGWGVWARRGALGVALGAGVALWTGRGRVFPRAAPPRTPYDALEQSPAIKRKLNAFLAHVRRRDLGAQQELCLQTGRLLLLLSLLHRLGAVTPFAAEAVHIQRGNVNRAVEVLVRMGMSDTRLSIFHDELKASAEALKRAVFGASEQMTCVTEHKAMQ